MDFTKTRTESIPWTKRTSTGSEIMDVLLEGGLESGIITTAYGPSGSGKTNLCIQAAIATAKRGRKVLYIDTEGGFSPERMSQIDPNYKETIKHFMFLRPTTFIEQNNATHNLREIIDTKTGLIIIDTISMLYRLELAKNYAITEINTELTKQLGELIDIAWNRKIPLLITNQVYADFEKKDRVKMVGGDILRYSSKCLIELTRDDEGRKAILRKHRSIPEESEVKIEITNSGIVEKKEKSEQKEEKKFGPHQNFLTR